MKKCYISKFPHEEFYKCKIDETFNFYDVHINCAKFKALNNKNFKLFDENHNTKNLKNTMTSVEQLERFYLKNLEMNDDLV